MCVLVATMELRQVIVASSKASMFAHVAVGTA